jgi:hypothetical protein
MNKHRLMNDPVEMKDLFAKYLESRMNACAAKLFLAIANEDEIISISKDNNHICWSSDHFSRRTYNNMAEMNRFLHQNPSLSWDELKGHRLFPICLDQVIKQSAQAYGGYDHFLAFYEEMMCLMWNRLI